MFYASNSGINVPENNPPIKNVPFSRIEFYILGIIFPKFSKFFEKFRLTLEPIRFQSSLRNRNQEI